VIAVEKFHPKLKKTGGGGRDLAFCFPLFENDDVSFGEFFSVSVFEKSHPKLKKRGGGGENLLIDFLFSKMMMSVLVNCISHVRIASIVV